MSPVVRLADWSPEITGMLPATFRFIPLCALRDAGRVPANTHKYLHITDSLIITYVLRPNKHFFRNFIAILLKHGTKCEVWSVEFYIVGNGFPLRSAGDRADGAAFA